MVFAGARAAKGERDAAHACARADTGAGCTRISRRGCEAPSQHQHRIGVADLGSGSRQLVQARGEQCIPAMEAVVTRAGAAAASGLIVGMIVVLAVTGLS